MTTNEEFTALERTGDHVVKRLRVEGSSNARFAAAMARGGTRRMRRYLGTLRDAGVLLADDLTISGQEPVTIRHRWMEGPTLPEAATVASDRFVDAVLVIDSWVEQLTLTDARVDTNLENFCLSPRGPVLVDVLPALVPSQCPEPVDSFDVLLHALCFDTSTTREALAGYALRTLISNSAYGAGERLIDRLGPRPAGAEQDRFPGMWFLARTTLATDAVRGRVSPDLVREFFALTSVVGFRKLAESERLSRIRQIERRIAQLGLV